ncbi:unnamed protein product, partial [Owenia fusiformis]
MCQLRSMFWGYAAFVVVVLLGYVYLSLNQVRVTKIVSRIPTPKKLFTKVVLHEDLITTVSTQKYRLGKIKEGCKKHKMLNFTKTPKLNNPYLFMFVDEKRKIVSCHVQKAGSTLLNRILAILIGDLPVTNPLNIPPYLAHNRNDLKSLNEYKPADAERILKTYYKYLFVRDPLSRLISFYEDKLYFPDNEFRSKFGRKMISVFRPNASAKSLRCGHDVTFKELFNSAINAGIFDSRPAFAHYGEQIHVCHPCQIEYDFIGKQETMISDIKELFRQINVSHLVNMTSTQEQRNIDAIVFKLHPSKNEWNKLIQCESQRELIHRI